MAMTLFDKLVQRIGDKKIKKYFCADKSVGIVYTDITSENKTTQVQSQLYVSADKHHFYYGNGTDEEVIGDFRVSGLLADRLESMVSNGLRELGKRRPFKGLAIQTLTQATEYDYPDDCIRVKKVELDQVELFEHKVIWEGHERTIISNFKLDNINRKIVFMYPTSGSLSVEYFLIPAESYLNEDLLEAVLNYATAQALREVAVQVKREKTIAMDGIPDIKDNAKDFEDESDRYMDRFEKVADFSYGVF